MTFGDGGVLSYVSTIELSKVLKEQKSYLDNTSKNIEITDGKV